MRPDAIEKIRQAAALLEDAFGDEPNGNSPSGPRVSISIFCDLGFEEQARKIAGEAPIQPSVISEYPQTIAGRSRLRLEFAGRMNDRVRLYGETYVPITLEVRR